MGNKQPPPTALFRGPQMGSRDLRNALRVAEMLRIVSESDSPDSNVAAGPFVDEDTAWNTLKKLAKGIE